MTKPGHHPIMLSRRSLLGAGAGTLILSLAGCGGDAGVAGVGSGGTGSFSSGPIRGFGSIVVGTIHYDEAGADIVDDAGQASHADNLRLGMVVEVNGAAVTTTSTGQRRAAAHHIAVRSEIEGPVAAIDEVSGSFTVLDQIVVVTPSTVFEEELKGGLQALKVGQVVEVSGLMQDSGLYTATRVEPEHDAVTRYKLRGRVSDLDASARTLRLGGARISWAGVSPSGGELADGRFVRVELATDPDPDGTWHALVIQVSPPLASRRPSDGNEVEIEGYVGSVSGASSSFTMLGITVDYSGARFEDGTVSDLVPGARVEVEGQMSADGSVLVAREIEFEDDDDDEDDDEFEVEGPITSVSPSELTFVVRGITVDYSRARFEDGQPSDLQVGVRVEVEGRLSTDGTTLIASEIEFDD